MIHELVFRETADCTESNIRALLKELIVFGDVDEVLCRFWREYKSPPKDSRKFSDAEQALFRKRYVTVIYPTRKGEVKVKVLLRFLVFAKVLNPEPTVMSPCGAAVNIRFVHGLYPKYIKIFDVDFLLVRLDSKH